MKRVRIYNDKIVEQNAISDSKPIKYYAVGEYGTNTFRPHYHAIIFNLEPRTVNELTEIWGLGHVSVGTAEIASVHYVTKYVIQPTKEDIWLPLAPPFSLISKGVGRAYLDTNGFYHKETLKNTVAGHRGFARLPRYYADKIYSIRDKEKIRENTIQQSDALYRKTVEQLKRTNPEAAAVLEKITRDRHDQIEKSFKQMNSDNLTND